MSRTGYCFKGCTAVQQRDRDLSQGSLDDSNPLLFLNIWRYFSLVFRCFPFLHLALSRDIEMARHWVGFVISRGHVEWLVWVKKLEQAAGDLVKGEGRVASLQAVCSASDFCLF